MPSTSDFGYVDHPSSRTSLFDGDVPFGVSPQTAGSAAGGFGTPGSGFLADMTPMQKARVSSPLIDGSVVSPEELETDDYGSRLMAIRSRTTRYGFTDALLKGSMWDFVPFFGMFATAGHDLAAARDASNAFQKLLRGETLTRDEAIRATLWKEEQEMKAQGSWGATFGGIVRSAPAFALEMGVLGSAGGVARSSAAKSAVESANVAVQAGNLTDDLVSSVARWSVTRSAKRGAMFEIAPMFTKSAVEAEVSAGRFTSTAAAAKSLLEDPVAVRKLTEQTASGVANVMKKANPDLTSFAEWVPGLQERVTTQVAERAVRANLAYLSKDSAWARWFDSTRRAVMDSAAEGLIDLGSWGSEATTTLTTTHSRASRAFAQAALDLTVYPATRGAVMFAPREAVTLAAGKLAGAVTGNEPVRRNTLDMQYDAWRTGNPDLMDRAETYGLVLDLLEYVSENTGRGFNSFMRGVGLSVAPNLIRPARKVAGMVETTGATKVIRDSATQKVTDIITPVGLVDAASSAEVGGVISRYVDKVLGGRSLREGMAHERLTATLAKLKGAGVRVADTTALAETIERGTVSRMLDPRVAQVIGNDVKGFVEGAVREAQKNRVFGMKTHAMAMYYALDFMARHNFDGQRVYEAFKTMGYDGIVAEMFEERYIDVVKELFGIDSEQKDFTDRFTTALQRLVVPEGGWKQLLAEAAGFAVPAFARAGTARAIAAMGSPNAYAKHNMWSASVGDLFKYGSIGTFSRPGDYIAKVDEQIANLRQVAEDQRRMAEAGTENGVPLTEVRKADLLASSARHLEGASRAERLRRNFLATLGVDTDEFAAPIYSDAALVSGDFEFERHLHLTAEQARRALVEYRNVIAFSPEVGQLQYKARHKTPEEAGGWFRRVAHWATEHAVRAAGFAATGELSFLSAEPAAFAAQDKGVDRHFLDVLHDGYAQEYDKVVRRLREGAADGVINVDTAHQQALEAFRPKAEAIVASYFAASQVLMFSRSELRDIALAHVAEEEGFVIDAKGRELVRPVIGEDGKPDPRGATEVLRYADFESRPGIKDRIDAQVADLSKVAYDALTVTSSERANASVLAGALDRSSEAAMLRAIARIPAGLPTAQQALLAAVLRFHPAFAGSGDELVRNIMIEKKVDPNRPLADQLTGVANYKDTLDAVLRQALGPDVRLETPKDIENAIAQGIDRVDPGTMDILGNALGYSHDFTQKGIRDRNAKVLRYALQTTAFDDPDRAVFSRPAPVAEEGERFGSTDSDTVVAVHSGGKWAGEFLQVSTNKRVAVSAPTLEELERKLEDDDFGYSVRRRRIIHTPVRVLYGDSALDFIRALNLGKEYRELQEAVYRQTFDKALLDPLLRKDEAGDWLYTPEQAEDVRNREASLAEDWERHGRQGSSKGQGGYSDVTHWLEQGETADDKGAVDRARDRMIRARDAWFARESRQKDGRPLGYNALAEDLVSKYGVRGSSHSAFENKFAVVDPGARGRFTMPLSAYSRRLGGDIYVTIDHGTAQSYSTSLLRGAINEALSRSFTYVKRMFGPYIEGFLVEVAKVVDRKIEEAGDDLSKAMWREFKAATVGVERGESHASGSQRGVSLATISSFIEAFCLYRTEVPSGEEQSALGDFWPQLKAIAPEVRRSPAYLPFYAMADYVLGGSGFTRLGQDLTKETLDGRRGLAFFYRLFAPNTESLEKAVEATLPEGKDALNAFIADVRTKAQAAFRPRVVKTSKNKRRTPPPTVTSVSEDAPGSPVDEAPETPVQAALAPAEGPGAAPVVQAEPPVPADATVDMGFSEADIARLANIEQMLQNSTSGSPVAEVAQEVVRQVSEENGRPMTDDEAAALASMLGGNSPDVVDAALLPSDSDEPAGEADRDVSDDGAQIVDVDEDVDEDEDVGSGRALDGLASVEPESPTRVMDEDGNPVQTPEAGNAKGLTADEASAFSSTIARALSFADPGGTVSADTMRKFLGRIAPGMDPADVDLVLAAYERTKGHFVGDVDWVFDEQTDEDGLTPDGYDLNNTHNVEVLKSGPIRRLLAILARVSPATGKDFQPMVEDLRSFVQKAPVLLRTSGRSDPRLSQAIDWLDKLLNPRANNDFQDACGRDAAYNDLVKWMSPPERGSQETSAKWNQVAFYVRQLLGKPGTPAPCARAALFISYLMGLPDNVRSILVHWISSSAAAVPIETTTEYDGEGRPKFRTEPSRVRSGSTSRESMVAALAMFAGRPVEELRAAADRIEKAFADEVAAAKKDGRFMKLVSAFATPTRVVSTPEGDGLFDVYARLLAPELGMDNPLVVAFMSRRFAALVRSNRETDKLGDYLIASLAKFAFPDNGRIPYAVTDLVHLMRTVAKASERSGKVDRKLLAQATISTFQSSSPAIRGLHFASSSVMGRGPWALLIDTYSRAKPVSVMRAKNDESRDKRPTVSVCVTMPGIEPVLQQFLDRPDDRGFRAVCREFFPELVGDGFDFGPLRQNMEWPDGTSIVAHQIAKTAGANEVREGHKAVYEDKNSEMLYVSAFAGDHTSGFIFQMPVAKVLRERGWTYEQAEGWVNDLLGIDLFGVDAKRSMLSSLEAPGISLVGIRKDSAGQVMTGEDGKPLLGRMRYGILWVPTGGASANEALKGSLGLYGYGARRARELARDPSLSMCKLHVASVGTEANGVTMPQITKALVSAHYAGTENINGEYVDGTMRVVSDYAKSLCGDDDANSAIVTDADSPKMTLVTSKMLGVQVGGDVKTIKDFVMEKAFREYLKTHKMSRGEVLSGDELDSVLHACLGAGDSAEHAGMVPVVNRAAGGEPQWVKLTDYVPNLAVKCVADGLYGFEYDASGLMGFQVANVAHKAKAVSKAMARNHLFDLGSMARVLDKHNADSQAKTRILPGVGTVTGLVSSLVSNYGLLTAAITTDTKSIDLALADNEDWKRLLDLKLSTSGEFATDIRRQVYSTWVNSIRTPGVRKIPSALVSSGAWIDDATGQAVCPWASQMFLDMQQGERSIAKADRKWWRAHKRVGLAGVNCTDVSFRHGLFIDEQGILGDAELAWADPGQGTEEQRVVAVLENVITNIVKGCSYAGDAKACRDEEIRLRELLGKHLVDHTGMTLLDRTFTRKVKKPVGGKRSKGTGKAGGETVVTVERVSYSHTVNFLDLFTRMTADRLGNLSFDRSAVYTGMHDHNGDVHMFLGGTKFAFTRIPSYNMHLEVVRAGLPVNTIATDGGWMCGSDATVAADPFSLKRLGNDNDGDKADLYMLDQRDGHLVNGDDGASFCYDKADLDHIFRPDFLDGATQAMVKFRNPELAREQLVAWRRWLVSEGLLVRERTRSKDTGETVLGKLALSPLARTRLSNTIVMGWFDMNSAIPVYDDEGDVPRYSGTVADGSRPGDLSRGVKPAVTVPMYEEGAPDDVYPEHTRVYQDSVDYLLEVAGPKLLDINDPEKRIRNGATSSLVETYAKLVSSARARFVAHARNLNVLWSVRAPEGLSLLFRPDRVSDTRDFVDSVFHLDGPSNMSFDDMKEQVCSRLGLWPGMADVFMAEYFVLGMLPTTDSQANRAIRAFASKVNTKDHLYNYMLRASNPYDFTYRTERLRKGGRMLSDSLLTRLFEDAAAKMGVASAEERHGAAARMIARLTGWLENVRGPSTVPASIEVGAYDCLRYCDESKLGENALAFAKLVDVLDAIDRGSRLARAINYSYADPGDPTAYAKYTDAMERLPEARVHAFGEPPDKRAPFIMDVYPEVSRMFAATQLLLFGDGQFAAYNRGRESADEFRGNYADALQDLDQSSGTPSYESLFLATAPICSKVPAGKAISLANNARTVGKAAATFVTAPQVSGSVFNDSEDGRLQLYRKCSMIAEAVSLARHAPGGPNGRVDVNTNVTADFLWFVETLLDVLSRLVSTSSAHRAVNIADLFREQPSGDGYAFSTRTFGPAVSGSARVSLALPDMSREQLVDLQNVVRRLVHDRVLDRDGSVGSTPWASYSGKKPGEAPYRPPEDIFYDFSVENMKRVLGLSRSQTGSFAQKVNAKAVASGAQRNIQDSLELVIGVFNYLSKTYPKDFPAGFSIQPSALFGQLLPVYAALTDVVMDVPGPGTRALSSAFLDQMALSDFLVGQLERNQHTAKYLRMAEVIDYGLAPGSSTDTFGKDILRSVTPRSKLAMAAFNAVRARGGLPTDGGMGGVIDAVAKPAKLRGRQPKPADRQPRPTLCVFDGPSGVVFEALVGIVGTYRNNPFLGIDERQLAGVPATRDILPRKANDSRASGVSSQAAALKEAALADLYGRARPGGQSSGGRVSKPVAAKGTAVQAPAPKVKWVLTPVRASTADATRKDQAKFNKLGGITKYIGFGGDRTSTKHYADTAFKDIANTGVYTAADIVGVSVNGQSKNRVPLSDPRVQAELAKAVAAGATIVADERTYREKSTYNVGEVELADYLEKAGYREDAGTGVWRPGGVAPETQVSEEAVAEIGRRMAQVFKLWDGPRLHYNRDDNTIDIYANMVVDKGDPNARVFKTKIKVHVTNGGLKLADRESLLKSISARSGVAYEKLASDRALADEMIKKYKVAGVTNFRFDDTPGSFRVSSRDLDLLVADVYLDARQVLLNKGDEFHEAFHAAVGFARAVGVLTDADIDALASQFGEGKWKGEKWFNEEQAAVRYQKIMVGEVKAAVRESKTSDGILAKIHKFIASLVEALRGIIGSHRSDAYANPFERDPQTKAMRPNPLLGFVLTGSISTSKGESETKLMDREARLYEALKAEFVAGGGVMDNVSEYALRMEAEDANYIIAFVDEVKRLAGVDKFHDDKALAAAIKTHGQQAARVAKDGADLVEQSMSSSIREFNRAMKALDQFGPVQIVKGPGGTEVVPATGAAATPVVDAPEGSGDNLLGDGGIRAAEERFGDQFGIGRTPGEGPESQVSAASYGATPAEEAQLTAKLDNLFGLPSVEEDDSDARPEPEGDGDQVLPKVRDALARAGLPMQMATPYGSADAMAALVGAILRNDATPEQREVAAEIAKRAATLKGIRQDKIDGALARVNWLYGTSPDKVSETMASGILRALAAGGYSTNGTARTVGGNPMRSRRSRTTRASLAAAVAVASGTTPADILEAALFDIRGIRNRRGSGNTLSDVVFDEHVIPALEALYSRASDATGLLEMFDPGNSEGPSRFDPHRVFATLGAGLVEVKDANGNRVKYRVADARSSNNPHHLGNVDLYKDHEEDPDFQRAMGIALDAVYMVAAARRMYLDLGFRPGTVDQALYAPGMLSPAEMAADLAAAPEQYEDPSFSAVDSGWFVAASQDDWLDSIMRPSFGSVSLKAAIQNSHRAVDRFRWRARSLNSMHALEYGLSGNPGDALIALDDKYEGGRFAWSEGGITDERARDFSATSSYKLGDRVRRGGRLWRAKEDMGPGVWDESKFDEVYEDPIRRYDHLGRTPAKDAGGRRIVMTRRDIRVVDLVLKARQAWLSGARKLVTGVDGLTFSYDMSSDVADYTRAKVEERRRRGFAGGETDFDRALHRLDIQLRDSLGDEPFDWITESGDGNYGLRDSLVTAACDALRRAKELVDARRMSQARVNDFVIAELSRAGLVNGVQKYSDEFKSPVYIHAAVALDPQRIEDLFTEKDPSASGPEAYRNETYRKLIMAGRREEWLSREAYLRPYADLVREMRQFALANPFISNGAARFFQSVTSPLPFSGGDGVTVYGLTRAAERDAAEVAAEVRTSFADAFVRNIGNEAPVLEAPPDIVLMARQLFHLPVGDVELTRRRLAKGDFAGVRGLEDINAESKVSDLVRAVARRLDDLVWDRSFGRRGAELFGGIGVVKSLVAEYRAGAVDANAPVPNVSGLAPDVVHRMTGRLPANFQAGHAVVNMVDGLANALAYRATLVNMVTTPDADGMPLCYAKPALDAESTTGVPDAVWGEVARWWGEIHGLAYDGLKTGVENARAMYDEIVEGGRIDKKDFGSINPEDMDNRAVEGFWARKGVPEGESQLSRLAGGYALGYAKHLFRSTKGLGSRWQREMIHRAWAYSKAMSVSFSLFFPIATRFESPVGAMGMMATLGSNISPEFVRRHAKALNGILGALGSPAWITRGFVGEADFAKMLDSNDPFLAEMYDFASAIGLTMSTSDVNPEENARGLLQNDLKNMVAVVREKFGDKAAKKVADISGALLTRASEKAFTYHLNATKLAVAAQLCMKLRADAATRGIAFDPVRDMRRYSSYVNAEIGGIDPLQYAWAHPGMQNFMNSLFFSWQWTRGAWEAGGGKIIEQVLFGGHDVTPEERKYIIGRAIRMYGWIAFGLPTLAQLLIKGIAMAIDPDHEDRDDEKWWIWENEDKANMRAFDLTPLMRAIAKRFPRYAEFRGEHGFIAGLPTAAFMLTKSPWLVPMAMPVYTGSDARNTTGGRHYYMRFGKQVWEFNRWFEDPFSQFMSKLSMPIQRLTEGVLGRSLTWMDHPLPWNDKGELERWLLPTRDSAIVNLLKAFMPFSFAGLSDMGDAGLLPVLGPVSMGNSGQAALKDLKRDLEAWVSNDRAWYRKPRDLKRASTGAVSLRRFRARVGDNPVLWHYVSELLANGYSEAQARKMVDRAVGDLRSERYRVLEDLVPSRPDGSYDTKKWSRTVRELQKLGRTSGAIYKALMSRLKDSTAWQQRASLELRRRYREMVFQETRKTYGERSY